MCGVLFQVAVTPKSLLMHRKPVSKGRRQSWRIRGKHGVRVPSQSFPLNCLHQDSPPCLRGQLTAAGVQSPKVYKDRQTHTHRPSLTPNTHPAPAFTKLKVTIPWGYKPPATIYLWTSGHRWQRAVPMHAKPVCPLSFIFIFTIEVYFMFCCTMYLGLM